MSRHKHWNLTRQMLTKNRSNVRCHEGCWTGQAALGGGVDGAAPASLVEAKDFDGARGEVGKEFIVAVYMVIEAMDED